jgi:hypothetical protein
VRGCEIRDEGCGVIERSKIETKEWEAQTHVSKAQKKKKKLNFPQFTVPTIEVPRGLVDEVVRVILHSILFHRSVSSPLRAKNSTARLGLVSFHYPQVPSFFFSIKKLLN